MSPSPLITIITAVYNDGRFLHLPLGSVREQTLQDYEQILVDDGSKDTETLRILDEISDPKVKVLHQANKGLPGARNTGIREARGKYILPLDADDTISPDCLEVLVRELESDPGLDVVYGNYETFGTEKRLLRTGTFNAYRLLFNNYMPVCSLYRRSAWEKVGGYTEAMKGFEDWEFWLKLHEGGCSFRKIEKTVYFHHVHDSNMWHRHKDKWKSIYDQIKSYHPKLFEPERIARLRREYKVTWLEDYIYHLSPPERYELRKKVAPFVPLVRALGLYRDS